MNRLLQAAAALVCAAGLSAFASTSNVTATLTDSDGTAWANCAWSAVVSSPTPPTISGVPVPDAQLRANGSCNGSGTLSATMLDTSSVDQRGVTWTFTITPNASVQPSVVSGVAVSGASVNLSTNLSSGIKAPRFNPGPKAYGYADAEVNAPTLGDTYFNTDGVCGSASLRQYNLAGWTCASGSSSGNFQPISGASAEYPLTDGTGTTVTDISGNGNNATFGTSTNSPTWYSYGVSFLDTGTAIAPSQYIVTPLTTFGTVYIAECTPVMVQTTGNSFGGVPANTYPALVGAVGGTGGIAFLGDTSSQTISNAVRPSIYRIGVGMTTVVAGAYGGCHVYGFSAGSTTDHFTVDGAEPSTYTSQTGSASFVPITGGGSYYIGSASTLSQFGLRGVITYAMFYPTAHTTAQMAQVTKYIQSKLAVRATYPHYPVLTNSRSATALFILDSLTAGYQGSSAWTGTLTLNHTYDIQNWAIGGMLALDGCTLSANRWEQKIVPGLTTVQVWGGTNDFVSGRSASDIMASLATCASTIKKYNGRAVVVTMISRVGNDPNKNALNALIRANYKQMGFDYLNDIAAVPGLGADGAYSNTACFNADQTHLTGPGAGTCATIGSTELSGYGVIAALSSNAINTMDGSSAANPDKTASNAFVSTYANNYVIQTPTGAATYQLVDCLGQTSPRTIVNGSGSNSITVSAVNSETITGSTTVAANATAVYMPILSSPTAGGCSWLRTQ